MFNNAVGRRGDIQFLLFFKASRCYPTGQQEEELVAEMVKRRRQAVNEAEITPQFFKIILFPHASKLHIPDEFVMKYGANMRDLVSLEVPSGAIWKVKLQNSNGMAWLKEGWDQFKEYYSIGCGYFLLFQYNGNSHFFVSIFDLSASEIEYPSGPSEDMTPENFVKIVGDASHRKKEGGPETNNNACDDIVDDFLRKKTAKVTKVADHSYSRRQKSGVPEWQDPIRVNLEKPDVEEDLYCATDKEKRKEIKKEKLEKQNTEKNLYHAADKGKEHCKEVLDPPASKMINTSRCNKRKYSTSLEAPHCRHPLQSKSKPVEVVKLDQSETERTMHCVKPKNTVVADSSHSGRQKTAAPISCPETVEPKKVNLEKVNSEEDFHCAAPKARRGETNMEKLEKQDVQQNVYAEAYKFKEHCNEVPVVDPSPSKMTTTNQQSEKETTTNLDASCRRYPLRSKQLKEVKLEKQDTEEDLFCAAQKAKKEGTNRVKLDKGNAEELYNEVPVVDPSAPKMTTTNQHTEKRTATSLDASHCRYPLRSKQLKDVNIEKRYLKEHCNEVSVVDLSASKMTTTNRHTERKTATSLDASLCRYPLRSKQLKDVNIEKRDLKEHCNEVSVVDLSASKMTTTNQHTEKKTATSLDASWCRYPLRSKQLKDVKIEKRDVEEHCNTLPVMDPSASKMTTTKQHSEKKTATSLDVSRCRYPLRSKQLKEVKLEQWGGEKNMHNLKPKNKVVADSPYCRRQNSGLPAPSPNFHPERKEPIRVKLEKPDVEEDLFCAAQKAKMKVTNNVKLEIGDVEGNLNSAAYKVKASEMTNTWQEKGYTLIDAQCSKLGNPYFIVSMQPTHVSRNFHLNIPCNFFRRYFKEEETIVVLRASDGRTWRARCSLQSNCARIHSPGWREFAVDNGLKVHDTCVFELMEGIELVLNVTIFRADSCFLKDSLPLCGQGFRACTSTSNSQAL